MYLKIEWHRILGRVRFFEHHHPVFPHLINGLFQTELGVWYIHPVGIIEAVSIFGAVLVRLSRYKRAPSHRNPPISRADQRRQSHRMHIGAVTVTSRAA